MAYGARLESELGESPQGFKSPILRAKKDPRLSGVFSLPGSRDLRRRGFASTESPILRAKKDPRLSGVFSLPGSRDLGADCVIRRDHLQSEWQPAVPLSSSEFMEEIPN